MPFLFLPFMGCMDYHFHKDPVSEEALPVEEILEHPKYPDMIVDPLYITEEGLCGGVEREVAILNAGVGTLNVSAVTLFADGWHMEEETLPLEIAAGEIYYIQLVGEDGAGILEIQTDDPANPTQWVELVANPDRAPEAAITYPYNGAIVPVGGDVVTAKVADDVDEPQSLLVEWHSDVDGLLGTSSPNEDGSLELELLDATPGDHQLSLVVKDSCENTTTFNHSVCQQYGYEVENLDISSWHFEGDAIWDSDNGWVQLTPLSTYRVGSAFSTEADVNAGNVEIEFLFYIGEGSGADGISLTAIDIDRMDDFLGGSGCGIGYGGHASCTNGPPLPGWSIEVDTYYNHGQDPTPADHLAFTFDGDVDGPAYWAELPEMEDTGWHSMRVQVSEPHVTVEIDGVVYMDTDLSGNFDFSSYVGFTAGTGGATNLHLIDSLTVTETVCNEG